MPRHINEEGLNLIRQWEGLRLTAYKDAVGVLTIGHGHTSRAGPPTVKPGMKITQAEADRILRADLAVFEAAVENAVKVDLTDNQFAALVSFTFNVGIGNLQKSTLLRKLNKGDYDGVPMELGKWVNAGGRRLPGLANRRAAEAGLWARGAFVSSNTVKPTAKKTNPYLNTETATMIGVPVATSALAAAANPGPLQWAVAAVIVIAAVVGAVFLIKRIREGNA